MPERAYISLTIDRSILVLQWQFNAYQLVNIASHSWPKMSLLDSSKENGALLLGRIAHLALKSLPNRLSLVRC